MFNFDLTHADWQGAMTDGMRNALTFRSQSNTIIMGAAILFWRNSKNVSYLNAGLQYVTAYKGLPVEGAKAFFVHFTGAKFDKELGKFVKGGKKKELPAEFMALEHWADWVKANRPEQPFDAKKLVQSDEAAIIRVLEKKLDAARDALKTVRSADELDTDTEAMILAHIAHTEALKAQAVTLYN